MRKSGIAFHCHHNTLFEYVHDYDERVRYIKKHKPEKERVLRLRLFRMIPNSRLPQRGLTAYDEARKAYDRAWEAYDKAREAYDEAREAYDEAREACDEARKAYDERNKAKLEKLHKELCPQCPFDGKTIFIKGVK